MWLFIALSLMAIVLTIRYGFYKSGESEHDKCLKNIGKLEMELFPDLPKELRWAKWPGPESFAYGFQSNFTQIFPTEPGAIITLNRGEKIDWLSPPALSSYIADCSKPKDQWHPVGELH